MRTSVSQLRDIERLLDLLRREALYRVEEVNGNIDAVLREVRAIPDSRFVDGDLAAAAFSVDWPIERQRKIAKLNARLAKLTVLRSDALAAVQSATVQCEGVAAELKREEMKLKRKKERAVFDRMVNDRLCMSRRNREL